jgi:hypothetical protein
LEDRHLQLQSNPYNSSPFHTTSYSNQHTYDELLIWLSKPTS